MTSFKELFAISIVIILTLMSVSEKGETEFSHYDLTHPSIQSAAGDDGIHIEIADVSQQTDSHTGCFEVSIDDDVPESLIQLRDVASLTDHVQFTNKPITIQLITDYLDDQGTDYTKEYYMDAFYTMAFHLSNYMDVVVVTESDQPNEETDQIMYIYLQITIPAQCDDIPSFHGFTNTINLYNHNFDYLQFD